jgi:plastocyanin
MDADGRPALSSATPLVFAISLLACSACSGPTPFGPAADAILVQIRDNEFSPQAVTVDRGKTVAWTNNGQLSHRVVVDGSGLTTHEIAPTAWSELRFDEAGTFTYHCSVHPAKTATVIVE